MTECYPLCVLPSIEIFKKQENTYQKSCTLCCGIGCTLYTGLFNKVLCLVRTHFLTFFLLKQIGNCLGLIEI